MSALDVGNVFQTKAGCFQSTADELQAKLNQATLALKQAGMGDTKKIGGYLFSTMILRALAAERFEGAFSEEHGQIPSLPRPLETLRRFDARRAISRRFNRGSTWCREPQVDYGAASWRFRRLAIPVRRREGLVRQLHRPAKGVGSPNGDTQSQAIPQIVSRISRYRSSGPIAGRVTVLRAPASHRDK